MVSSPPPAISGQPEIARISGSKEAEKGLWEMGEMLLCKNLRSINCERGWLAGKEAAVAVEGLDQGSVHGSSVPPIACVTSWRATCYPVF